MRYKIVACILILSAFSFVPAAPVPVREIREAWADAVEGDEGVIIVSGKRAPAPRRVEGNSDREWAPSLYQTPPAPDWSHLGVDKPSSPSAGSTSPLSSTPGGTEAEGAFKPAGITTENQPTSPSKPKSVSWAGTTKVHFIGPEPLRTPPGREAYLTKVAQQRPSPEIEHIITPNYFSPPPPKPQPKGFSSKLKTFFSKLGKLIFFTRP